MAKKIKIDNVSTKFKRQSQKRVSKVVRCSVLIVCEGTKTEPNYFEAFAKKQQGVIVYDIEVKGLGRGTKDVVEKAINLKSKNNYDRVWAVFDKDEFPAKDFNDAITLGTQNGIEVAWSNEAFELWYLYHFRLYDRYHTKMQKLFVIYQLNPCFLHFGYILNFQPRRVLKTIRHRLQQQDFC